jgi:hypothetical protein
LRWLETHATDSSEEIGHLDEAVRMLQEFYILMDGQLLGSKKVLSLFLLHHRNPPASDLCLMCLESRSKAPATCLCNNFIKLIVAAIAVFV